MPVDDDKIRYRDIIEPDDSIEKLINQMSQLNKSYETMINAIRAGADRIVHSMKSASGATEEGRKAIDEATSSTSRLERAQKELKLALSDTGKQIAWLKAQTSDANKATVEQRRYLKQVSSSYDRLKSDLQQAVNLYKSLSAAEREDSEMGQQLLQDILNLKNQIKALDEQMKPHINTITETQKAEQRLAFLQSEEGQRLLDLKAKIAELTSARRQHKAAIDPLAQAQEKLAYAQSAENEQLKLYSTQIREANRVAQLRAQINSSAEGSYNRLSAQYALNKIRLNQMSQAEREATESGRKLVEETNAIYQQMIKLQEATGNYRLSVGHYQRTWDGLGISISQVVRELPAAAVSLNTFFLGISNNIPMVVDEINRLRAQNKALQAEGKATVSVTRSIIRSLLSWNTALVVLLTVFSMYGKEIIEAIKNSLGFRDAVISTSKAIQNINEELKNNSGGYGDNIVTLKQLQQEWNNLKTVAEKKQWIKDNQTEFNKLGVSVNNVTDAENIFVDNTPAVINALKLRARAAAAQALAAEKYEEALRKGEEAKNVPQSEKNKTMGQFIMEYLLNPSEWTYSAEEFANQNYQTETPEARLLRESKVAEETADAYFDLAASYEAAAKASLKASGIEENHRKTRERKGRQPRDLTNIINRNDINIQKQYEESITKLQDDEFAKRRKSAADQVQDANNKLREMYRKNVEYVNSVDGKYKELTNSQKKQIEQQQDWITKTIANNLQYLANQLKRIQREQQVNSLQIRREAQNALEAQVAVGTGKNTETTVTTNMTVTRDASQMEQSLVEERKLMEENLKTEYNLVIDTNRKLLAAGDNQARSEEEIITELNKKKIELWAQYDKLILEARERDIEGQLQLVKKGSDEELELLLRQNEIRRQLALAENAARPASEQVSSESINAQYNKSGQLIRGSFYSDQLDEQQALDEAIFNEVERSEYEITNFKLLQERERWLALIKLAEEGSLDWSNAQIETAKATVESINKQLSNVGIGLDIKSTDANLSGGFKGFVSRIGKNGFGQTLLESMGFNEDQIKAMDEWTNTIIDNIQDIMDAEIEAAQQAVELAQERVDAAQKAYDAEIEARNNGYANNVATAKKELEQEKKNQAQKQRMLEEAQRRQQQLDSIMQASSLVTASANIWSSLSKIPIVGPSLAIAMIATMWTSFAAAKIRAKQITASSEEQQYGEGGLEFLEGGSHASGHDIELGITNKKKKRMKAEGGEALAIVNKKNTRKYRKILPDVINSFNKGTFEDKYLSAFASPANTSNIILNSSNVDLSQIENDVRSIKKQNEIKYYTLSNGTIVIQHKNVKRIIKN